MYLEYYSLDIPPFRITPDPSLFYTGGASGRGVVLEALLYAVQSGEGILKVVGEVGSGKTMLCRMLEQRLPKTVEIVYLANPNLSPHDILYAIAFELKLPIDHRTERLVLMHHLQDYLLKQHAANRSVLVIIEEAQSMPIETLEEIRLFSNLETHQHKLMQILLFGQPELDTNLENKAIRQLRERITHSFYLRPLSVEETRDYIRFRLQAAGCPCPQVFEEKAEKLIAKASGGLTRRINILADKSMLAAYGESATATRPRTIDNQLTPTVLVRHVRAAIRDSDYANEFGLRKYLPPALAALLVLGVGIGGYWWGSQGRGTPDTAAVAVAPALSETRSQTQLPVDVSAPPQQLSAPAIDTTALIADAGNSTSISAVSAAEDPVSVSPALETLEVFTPQVATPPEITPEVTPPEIDAPVIDSLVVATPAAETPAVEAPVAEVAVVETPVEEVQVAENPVVESSAVEDVPVIEVPITDRELEQYLASLPALLRERNAAWPEWLSTANSDPYVIQLISVNRRQVEDIHRVLRMMEQAGLIEGSFACMALFRGEEYWKVFYGSFNTVDQARRFFPQLPRSIRNNEPFVQNISRLDCTG